MLVESKKGLIFRYVSAGRFPGEGGVVAPGMSCKYIVRFAPDSLGDYEDFITVETQVEHLLVVPIVAGRPPPVLTCESHYNPPTFSQETVQQGVLLRCKNWFSSGILQFQDPSGGFF